MLRIRPVRRPQPLLKRIFLPPQIRLARVLHRHEARVHCEPVLRGLRRDVVVRGAAVPDDEVARVRAHFDPLQPVGGEPGHAGVGEAVPLGSPGGDAGFGGESGVGVEGGGEAVPAFADDEAAVEGAVGVEVYEALEAWGWCVSMVGIVWGG